RADALGRSQVAFKQHWRDTEHVCVVVEPAARIIRRQHRRDVTVERQQIANGIRVLSAVQTMREWAPWIGIGSSRGVESQFKRGDRSGPSGGVTPRQTTPGHYI